MMWHILSGIILYDASGSIAIYVIGGRTYYTLNLNIGGGLQQKLSDKFSLFEKFQGNYQVIENSGYGDWYLYKL